MKVSKFFIIIIFLLSGSASKCLAQKTEPEPLDSFLIYLENRFNVVFSFADANINDLSVNISRDLNLEEFLIELEKQTGLIFERINSRYIAIHKKSTSEIIISGILSDNLTNERISGAVVLSGNKHTLSDENGFFSVKINLAEDSVLTIRHVGYKTLVLGEFDLMKFPSKFKMERDIRVLEEVKLHYIAQGIDKLRDGSVQMNIRDIEVLPGLSEPDVLQTIQVLPGIQSVNETISEINTRGGTNDQSLVLWDGVKMYQSGHFFGLISAFNSHLIHKTKIIKNGTSASYDEGISGIIDMRQQDNLVNDLSISTGLNMLSADVIAKIPVSEKLSFIFGARHSINGIIETPTYKSYYKRAFEHTKLALSGAGTDTTLETYQDFSFYDVSARLLYDITEKDKLRLSLLNNNNNIEYEENSVSITDSIYSRVSYLSQKNILSNFTYSRTLSENNKIEMSAFLSSYYLEGRNVSIADNQIHLQENEVLDWGLRLESDNKFSNRFSLSGGYQFKEAGIRNLDNIRKPNYIRNIKDVLRIHSLYTEAEFSDLFNRLYIRTGLRANYFPKFQNLSFEPRLALDLRLNKYFSLEIQAEKKSQHTTQLIDFQTDFLGIEKRRWVLSNNESVPLLKSLQFSAGIKYNRNNFLVSVEAYEKKVTGIITPSQGFQNQFQFVYSAGEYNARGIELLINKQFKNFSTWITYTLAKNDYYYNEFTPSVFPNNLDVRHSLSMGGSITHKKFEFSGGFNFRTGKPHTMPEYNFDEPNQIEYKEPNSSRLKNYARLDISAKYSFNIKTVKAKIGFSVWNILNRNNVYNIFYQLNQDNEIEKITQNTLGITPNVNIRVAF